MQVSMTIKPKFRCPWAVLKISSFVSLLIKSSGSKIRSHIKVHEKQNCKLEAKYTLKVHVNRFSVQWRDCGAGKQTSHVHNCFLCQPQIIFLKFKLLLFRFVYESIKKKLLLVCIIDFIVTLKLNILTKISLFDCL